MVPENVCVASRADVGAGTVQIFDRENAGIDVNWEDTPPVARDVPVVVVHGDVGMGVLQVRHTDPDQSFQDSDLSPGNTACATGRATR